jgi:hypothetical protein
VSGSGLQPGSTVTAGARLGEVSQAGDFSFDMVISAAPCSQFAGNDLTGFVSGTTASGDPIRTELRLIQ